MSDTTLDPAFAAVERMLREGPVLRVVNFHHTPPSRVAELEQQLGLLSRHFAPVDEAALEAFCETGEWQGPKPGVLPVFYNGYRSNFDVARPLLERFGLIGWFFVVTGFVSAPAAAQAEFAARHRMSGGEPGAYPDGRLALSWDELRALDGPHVVASHTRTHVEVESGNSDMLRGEIVGAQDDLRAGLGHPVKAFAANRGGAFGENAEADRLIREAGYRFVFSNLKVQRIG